MLEGKNGPQKRKNLKVCCFSVLNDLFGGLEASLELDSPSLRFEK
jgi:hypothetical protein